MSSEVRQKVAGLCFSLGLGASTTSAWQPRDPWPPPLASHVMTYVSTLSRVVLFGGTNPAREMSATLWSWDGVSWVVLDEDGPSPRIHAGMAYDTGRDRLLVFGGIGSDGKTLADTWEWDGEQWMEIVTRGLGPGPRDHHALAYDPVRES
ncbi:MAG TPA: kelch repeat-containing protein, partial [Vicinamibacteria bacterium]|nr:kelch repeat-containing protein [Vicinamibacteria bacterium]